MKSNRLSQWTLSTLLLASVSPAQITPDRNCATGLFDRANPATCLAASSVPTLGRLYPLSPQLFVSPQGFVGIGTTSPTAPLHVAGGVRISGRSPWTDVKALGAVGDGTTDDTAALQAAIDAAGTPGGGIVFLPPGTYRHTGLRLRSNVSLVGVGAKVSVLRYTGTGDAVIIPAGRGTNIKIRSLKIEAVPPTEGTGIRGTFGTTREFVMEDYEVEGFVSGLRLSDTLNSRIGMGRWLGPGRLVRGSVGINVSGNALVVSQPYVSDFEQGINLNANATTAINPVCENCVRGLRTLRATTVISGWYLCDSVALDVSDGGWVLTQPHVLDPVTQVPVANPFITGQVRFLTPAGTQRSVSLHWGKGYMPGGVDPPYMSFSGESRESIRKRAADLTEHENTMLFWNARTRRMELYVRDEDRFRTVQGDAVDDADLRTSVRELREANARLERAVAELEQLRARLDVLEKRAENALE